MPTIKTDDFELSFSAGLPVPQTDVELSGRSLRAGSWAEFERRFNPLMWSGENGDDTDVILDTHVGLTCDPAHVWTVVEGDNGEWYLCEGWHLVNRMGYVIARNPRFAMPEHGGAYKIYKY